MNKFWFLLLVLLGFSFSHAQTTGLSYRWPLDLQNNSKTLLFTGHVDPAKYSKDEIRAASAWLYISAEKPFVDGQNGSDPHPGKRAYQAVSDQNNIPGFQENGDYFFSVNLGDLTPATKYYMLHEITIAGKTETKAKDFPSDGGYMTEAEVADDFERRSYRLLTPLPGLSVLLDPDLCMELLREGKEGQYSRICSEKDPSGFNAFLNYFFKLLIGVCAVLLVLRLMYEGYQYAVTDIPFLKASSKSNFFTALMGLLLALSAYLILNSINPKLVTNDIKIGAINLSVEESIALSYVGYDISSGKAPSPDDIKKANIAWESNFASVKEKYIPALDKALPNISKGMRTLMIAQTSIEGFYPNTKSYKTNNPGNIGNTDDGALKTFSSLEEGIREQYAYIKSAALGERAAYKLGKEYCLKAVSYNGVSYPGDGCNGEKYNGELYKYLRIYSTGARKSNSYLNFVVNFFKKEGITIDGYTKMADIYAKN